MLLTDSRRRSNRTISPNNIAGLAARFVTADSVLSGQFVVSVADRVTGQIYSSTASNNIPYVASNPGFSGQPTCSCISPVGFTFSQNLVPPGSSRTVVFFGSATSPDGMTLLQMSSENSHRVALVALKVGGYVAAGGASSVVGGILPDLNIPLCLIYTVSSSRAVTFSLGGTNLVTFGSPMSADDTGSTAPGGALLTQIPGLFGAKGYNLAEMLVYSNILTANEQTAIRRYGRVVYGIS